MKVREHRGQVKTGEEGQVKTGEDKGQVRVEEDR